MMTQEALIILLNVFCQISDSKIEYKAKEECINFMANCSVGTNGIIKDEEVERCKKIYKNNLEKK